MTARPGTVRVGIAGWVFPPWRGTFYPKGLRQADELGHAARQFRTLEINGTFYALQRPDTYAAWAAAVPDDFIFSMKAPRLITHMKRLKEVEAPLANFLASGPLRLGRKMGPILWQLPPNLAFDAGRVEAWLALLPHDRTAAAALARRHEPRLDGRAFTEAGEPGPVRHAVEVRHASFAAPAFIALLRRYNVALVCTDGHEEWPRLADLTADFVYCRLHVAKAQGEGGYGAAALDAWAERVRAWARGKQPADLTRVTDAAPPLAPRDVFVYFDAAGDEEVKLFTPPNAAALAARLEKEPP